jgi:hypothetical protein
MAAVVAPAVATGFIPEKKVLIAQNYLFPTFWF